MKTYSVLTRLPEKGYNSGINCPDRDVEKKVKDMMPEWWWIERTVCTAATNKAEAVQNVKKAFPDRKVFKTGVRVVPVHISMITGEVAP